MKAWHDDVAAALDEAKAAGVSLEGFSVALGVRREEATPRREMIVGEMEAFLLTPERFVE